MFNQTEYSTIKKIIKKISRDESIDLKERVMLEKLSSHNPEIFSKLKKAQCIRRLNNSEKEDLTNFLGSLALEGTFQNEHYNPRVESLEEWFLDAPKWLRRS